MAAAIRTLRAEGIAYRVLGGGANVLVDDRGLPGAVIVTDQVSRWIRTDRGTFWVECGHSIQMFVQRAKQQGLGGIECLVGVPGSIGGAVAMNAGGRYGEIGALVRRVRVLTPDGDVEEVEPDEHTFSYRSSIFGSDLPVVAAEIALQSVEKKALEERVRRILKEKGAAQPLTEPSAGCAFKNPDPERCSESAGRLLERAGVKGWRVGGAEVSNKHANFVVNRGGARLDDVLALLRRMREAVAERFGVRLEREVKVWSRDGSDEAGAD